uniref:Alternative protein SLC35E2B n=1 Tax=Homo sapiens TaxID=9606 RepID=L8E7I2_HUMAN|nr:alternative protein SLC35E2B [Homo sapiens]
MALLGCRTWGAKLAIACGFLGLSVKTSRNSNWGFQVSASWSRDQTSS